MPNLGPTEILLILLVVVLLFGAKKLPELARGSGRALRIFKSETKSLTDDEGQQEKPTSRDDELNDGTEDASVIEDATVVEAGDTRAATSTGSR